MQTFTNFELIIIDDNSTDNTEKIVKEFDDPRIRFLRNDQNLGPEGNWNRCLAEAQGVYFKLLPHDDILAPSCLERQMAVLETDADEGIALVFCARSIIDSHGRTIMSRYYYPQHRGGQITGSLAIQNCIRHGTNLIGEPGGVLFRKSLADAIGGFDASHSYIIDLNYWYRLLMRGNAFYLPEKLVSFRVHSRAWSAVIGKKQRDHFRSFITMISDTPGSRIGFIEVVAGNLMATVNNLLRMGIYKCLSRKR